MVSIAAYQAVMEFENDLLENKNNLNGIVESKADWQVHEGSWKDEKLEELKEAYTANFSEKNAQEREQKEWQIKYGELKMDTIRAYLNAFGKSPLKSKVIKI